MPITRILPFAQALSRRAVWLLLSALALAATLLYAVPALAADGVWSLDNDLRRAYLAYYAPVILKRANESSRTNWGVDWITNFDFDRDGKFSTNRKSWQSTDAYVANPQDPLFAKWKIRPTLYTSLIEFQEGTSKSLILLYHVYHAMEDDSIHDWERVEVRIDAVTGTPGSAGEQVRYVLVTGHSDHVPQTPSVPPAAPNPALNFMTTANGKHPIVFQAEWTNTSKPDKNELRHVTTTWAALDGALRTCPTCTATVGVTGTSTKQPVHYVFVPEDDAPAVAYWGAVALSHQNASSKAAKTNKTFANWGLVPRLTYELQDLADILPTHADSVACAGVVPRENGWGLYPDHWQTNGETVKIQMDTGVYSETGAMLIPPSSYCNSLITFYRDSRDVLQKDDAQGYPHKHWFWGAYVGGHEGHTDHIFEGTPFIDPVTKAKKVRLCPGGLDKYWCQHDYFVHTGKIGKESGKTYTDDGRWLPLNWHLPENGGFDGRWVQLFDDRF